MSIQPQKLSFQASQLESLETNTDTFHYLRDLENRITKISTDKEEQKPTHYSYDAIGRLTQVNEGIRTHSKSKKSQAQ